MTQWMLILLLAALPPYLNKLWVRRQRKAERFQARREQVRAALNHIYAIQERGH